jgi:hypothetical protein
MNIQSTAGTRPRGRPAKSGARGTCQRGRLFLGPNLAQSLTDASEEAIGLLTHEVLSVGEQVSLDLEGIAPRSTVQRLGRVVGCEPAEEGLFRIQVELETPLDYAELMSLSCI